MLPNINSSNTKVTNPPEPTMKLLIYLLFTLPLLATTQPLNTSLTTNALDIASDATPIITHITEHKGKPKSNEPVGPDSEEMKQWHDFWRAVVGCWFKKCS